MNRFRELHIWQKGFDIGLKVLTLTKAFPKSELYGLTSQINRSAVSIASNIAEGAGRESRKEFDRFLDIAIGSMYELETQLLFAEALNYVSKSEVIALLDELGQLQRMLRKFKQSIRKLDEQSN